MAVREPTSVSEILDVHIARYILSLSLFLSLLSSDQSCSRTRAPGSSVPRGDPVSSIPLTDRSVLAWRTSTTYGAHVHLRTFVGLFRIWLNPCFSFHLFPINFSSNNAVPRSKDFFLFL